MNAVNLLELNAYFRDEHGMIRAEARYYSRKVYRDRDTAHRLLPSGWFRAIWPNESTFTRRIPGVSDPTPRSALLRAETRKVLDRLEGAARA